MGPRRDGLCLSQDRTAYRADPPSLPAVSETPFPNISNRQGTQNAMQALSMYSPFPLAPLNGDTEARRYSMALCPVGWRWGYIIDSFIPTVLKVKLDSAIFCQDFRLHCVSLQCANYCMLTWLASYLLSHDDVATPWLGVRGY